MPDDFTTVPQHLTPPTPSHAEATMTQVVSEANFTPEQLAQLQGIREEFQHRAPGTYRQLAQYNETNHHRCVNMIGALIKQQYADVAPLFLANKEAVVAALFVSSIEPAP